ncbi:MAG TPA: WecB/TagA/CpsF family glycosyltransferase, partial [Lacipirellulaceae bacterium]|nr:WecB/TagA/CpsF family glycosyltransferase [Lacipirellulaceae bacterium]
MPIVAATFALAAIVWGAICARRGSLLVGCGLLVVISYVFGHEFWNADVGPLPITLDRIMLVGLLAAFAYQWRFGGLKLRPMTGSDWMLVALLAIYIASAVLSGEPEITHGVTSKWGRLLTSFLLPAVVYGLIRQLDISRRDWSRLLALLAVLGIYLACTGIFEVTGQWSLVFPHYISNPDLGIHFGRARGPDLNAESLGLYLTACLCCAWVLLHYVNRRSWQLALLIAMPLIAGTVRLTYTRAAWIGMAASGLVVAAFYIPRRWRLPAIAGAALVGLLVVTACWGELLGIKREGTVEDSEHSVGQRESFAYVSSKMFHDHPIFGVGFGRFYDQKLPYLSDRSQQVELESLRPLHHHNTILGSLTETGLVGLTAFVGLFAVWIRSGWRLATRGDSAPWVRAQGVLMLALLTNYLSSSGFHDLTLIPSQELLLFVFAGVTVNLCQSESIAPVTERGRLFPFPLGRGQVEGALTSRNARAALADPHAHVNLFGMQISRVTMRQTIDTLLAWCRERRGEACHYIVTPNTDHAVLYQQRGDLRAAYRDASLVLADGAPIVWTARLLGQPLPERVAGSDLVPKLFAAAESRLSVFLLGAAPGVADVAASRIARRWENVNVVGTLSPPVGFEHDPAENERIFSAIAAAAPDLLIVGLG